MDRRADRGVCVSQVQPCLCGLWSLRLPGPFYRNAPDGPAATGAQTALLSQQESVFSFYFTSRCPGLVCPFRLVIPCCRVGYLSQDVQESMLVCHLSSSRVSLSVLRLGISERQGRQIVIVQGSLITSVQGHILHERMRTRKFVEERSEGTGTR